MKRRDFLALICILVFAITNFARADEFPVSSNAPVFVTAPAQWKSALDSKAPFYQADTYRLTPPTPRNAVCLISLIDKNKPQFTNTLILQRYLMPDCRPYVAVPRDIVKVQFHQLAITNGLAFYANFIDPDLAGKPSKPGDYKTATPVMLSLGTNYLIKATILCDDLNGPDYRDAVAMLQTIRIKKK